MGRYLMKCAPDRDLYVEWSSVVDNAVWVGTRSEALRLPQTDPERLDRTDQTGTSTLWETEGYPREGSWDDASIHVSNTERRDDGVISYALSRSDLTAYAQALAENDTVRAEALLRCNRFCEVCETDRNIDPQTNLCPEHITP